MDQTCPYCRGPLQPSAAYPCPSCGTPHHTDCWRENRGCTVFGCQHAPSDEPKINIHAQELGYAPAPHTQAATTGIAYGTYSPGAAPIATSPQQLGVYPARAPVVAYGPPLHPTYYSAGNGLAPIQHGYFQNPPVHPMQKSRLGFIVLGIFLGFLGIHNFYAGYIGRAVAQLLITVLSLGLLSFVSWIWAIVEICVIGHDAKGLPFAD